MSSPTAWQDFIMIASTVPPRVSRSSRSTATGSNRIEQLLENVRVVTGDACTHEVSAKFLQTTSSVTQTCPSSVGPSKQDMECLRQAAWKYRLETGESYVSARELIPTLERLGYV